MSRIKKGIIVVLIMTVVFGYWIYSIADSAGMGGQKINWVNDINQLEQTLVKESPGAFRQVSKKEFHKELQQLIKETSKLSDSDITIKLTDIVESLKDNNTHLVKKNSKVIIAYPLYLVKIKDKYLL